MSLASQRVRPLHFGVRTKRETASTETSLQMKILKMEKKRKINEQNSEGPPDGASSECKYILFASGSNPDNL